MKMKWARWMWSATALIGLGVIVPFAGCGGGDPATSNGGGDAGAGDDATTTDGASATCGNGKVERGEDCDDSNKVSGDGCQNDCTFTCTKGTVNGDSRCDDHEPCNGAETCTDNHTCAKGTPIPDPGSCGNNKICRNGVCSDSVCGDGVVTAPEECDDANSAAGDGCEPDCKYTCVLGDSARSCKSTNTCVHDGTCDTAHKCTAGAPVADGTTCPGTGMICAAGACVAAHCGDGVVTAPEQCDDANQTNGDGCNNDCKFSCANPATDCPAAAVCNVNSCTAAHVCQSDADATKNGQSCGTNLVCKSGACVSPSAVCGNGTIETGEDCDFGAGNGAGTGCESNCKFSCTTSPNSCDDKNPCNGAETCGAVTVNGKAGQKCAAGTPLGNGTACGTGNICLSSACKQSVCGDTYVDTSKGEQCEPPNAGNCDANCHTVVCGNGTREQGEQCDDGNLINLDGCDGTCKFEQEQRVNQLKMQFATDAYCKLNALGGAIGATAQGQIQTPLDDGVKQGTINVLFKFSDGDLSGASGNVTLGSIAGAPVEADGGVYNGNTDLDWWYTVDPTSINAARNPINTLAGAYTAKTLNAGPGRFSLSLLLSGSPAKLQLWNSILRTAVGATSKPTTSSAKQPGHLAGEHLDPALQSFASSGVGNGGAAAGQLCGNVTTGSLSTVAVPTVLLSGVSNCVEAYAATNSLLDVYIGGCHVLGGLVTVISQTQPDQIDTTAPQAGAGGPYTLSASTGHTVDTCKDKNKATVPLAICFGAMAYSSSFKFTTDRVIIK